jgi:glutamate synthase (NADPH/NADH) small chain
MSQYRPIPERIKDYNPVELRLTQEEIKKELKRCQDCGIPFCHATGCPLYNLIPEIHSDALHDRWDSALCRLLETSPFPEFTARICPALCEGSCVQALDDLPVPARLVEYEVIERGFSEGKIQPVAPKNKIPLNVGIIGSGPSGLAAAHLLNKNGATVTVYEKDAKPGGFLRYGIPDFKLEKSVIDRRIDLMRKEGISFFCGVEAGVDMSVRLLKKRHKVLILALGSRKKRDLDIPGRGLTGVHFATDYLSAQNRTINGEYTFLPSTYNAFGRKVVVIGGGDTGSDCLGTAWRQGASDVQQFEIMPKPPVSRNPDNPWPQWPRILRTTSSHQEGGKRRWNISTTEFLPSPASPDRVGSIQCTEVKWEYVGSRPSRPVPQPGTEFIQKADLVLLAMGFVAPDLGNLAAAEEFKPDGFGRVGPGIYAAGDAVTGPSLVVRAISDGLKVASTILTDYEFSHSQRTGS